jgi:hypothetical protein
VNPAVLLLALGIGGTLIAVALLLGSRGRHARLEIEAGIEALRTLRWKDFAQHVVHAFETRGYQPQAGQRKPGEDGVDYLLTRGRDKHLLQIKHGGAYAVGAAPVRRMLSLLDPHGATGGILVTSGHFETPARQAAKGQAVVLIDGEALWAQLTPVLPSALVEGAAAMAAERFRQRRGKLQLALVASVLTAIGGAAIYGRERMEARSADVVGTTPRAATTPAPKPGPPPAASAVSSPTPTPAEIATPPASAEPIAAATPEAPPAATPDAAPATTPATETAAAETAPGDAATVATAPPPPTPAAAAASGPATEAELAGYRAGAAAAALQVEGVVSASWPTRSTLLIAMKAKDEAARMEIVRQVCVGLAQHEELEFTRLQLLDYDTTSGDTGGAVRWRQCN